MTMLLLLSQPNTSSAKNDLFGNPNLRGDDIPISTELHDNESSMSMSMSMPDTVPVPQFEVSKRDIPNPNDTNDVPNPNLPTGDDDTGEFANPNFILTTTRPTRKPSRKPTEQPTDEPSPSPTEEPTLKPTRKPTRKPTPSPTPESSAKPTSTPTSTPTSIPSADPTPGPTPEPTPGPTPEPTTDPTLEPTNAPLTKAPVTEEVAEEVTTTTTSTVPESSKPDDLDDETGEDGNVPVASPGDKDETDEEAATNAVACNALVNGTSPSTDVSSTLNYTYEVTLGTTDSDEVESVIDKIEKNIKLYVGAQLFGCNEPVRLRRRMESAGTAMGVHGYPSERVLDGETCEIPSDDCFVASGGMTLIMNNGTSTEDAEASTLDALKIIHEAMNVQNPSPFVAGEKYGVANVKGVGFLEGTTAYGASIDKEGAVTTDSGTTIDEIKSESTTAQSNSRMSTGGIVALSLCLLALVLALVLLNLRKSSTFKELQNEEEASESDSDVFDDVSMDDDTMSLQSPRKKRAYIVGEEESVYTRDTKVCTPEGWPSDEEGVEITNENIDRIYPLRMGRQTKFISVFDDGREVSVPKPFENPGAIRRRSLLIEDTVDL